METLVITGDNYNGNFNISRTACRSIVIKDGKILMSYETNRDQWMIPGGGIEPGESAIECVIRETKEETGYIIKPSECLLEIREYYEDWEYINRYYTGEIIGQTERKLTEAEIRNGLEPRWVNISEMNEILSSYKQYALTNEMRCGMYYREYSALNKIVNKIQKR